MCRLLARMTSQRRSVPCAELAAVRAGSARCDGGPMATRPEALQVVDAGAARMLSSPEHTPLRVRVRPGDPEPEDALDGKVRVRLFAARPLALPAAVDRMG